jgi:hypothetical protein
MLAGGRLELETGSTEWFGEAVVGKDGTHRLFEIEM